MPLSAMHQVVQMDYRMWCDSLEHTELLKSQIEESDGYEAAAMPPI
jgi:hypothetical protein